MDELELVRLHEDGEHLVLGRADGGRFTLRIDDALRAAVRRDRAQLEQLRAQAPGVLPVREIQAQLRAGHSAREVAEKAGIAIEQVRRFEGPVLAEQEFVVEQVRKSRPGHEEDSATLGELVTERLTARGVAPEDVEWSAARPHGVTWTVTALFLIGDRARTARWSYDPSSRALHELDDEARWLSGTHRDEEPVRGVRGALFDHAARGGRHTSSSEPGDEHSDTAPTAPEAQPLPLPLQDETTSILDDLSQRRGVRQHRDDDLSVFEGFGPPQTFDLGDKPGRRHEGEPGDGSPAGAKIISLGSIGHLARPRPDDDAHPSRSAHRQAPVDRDDLGPAEEPPETDPGAPDARPTPEAGRSEAGRTEAGRPTEETQRERQEPTRSAPEARRGGRKPRASVPSWDEIVFGAKPEH
jgi:hypothetical protein